MLSSKVRQVDLEPGVSGFQMVAAVSKDVVGVLVDMGVSFMEESEYGEAGPTRWAAVAVASGDLFLLVHHYRHPTSMLEIRARASNTPPALVMSHLLHALDLMPEVYDVLSAWPPSTQM